MRWILNLMKIILSQNYRYKILNPVAVSPLPMHYTPHPALPHKLRFKNFKLNLVKKRRNINTFWRQTNCPYVAGQFNSSLKSNNCDIMLEVATARKLFVYYDSFSFYFLNTRFVVVESRSPNPKLHWFGTVRVPVEYIHTCRLMANDQFRTAEYKKFHSANRYLEVNILEFLPFRNEMSIRK